MERVRDATTDALVAKLATDVTVPEAAQILEELAGRLDWPLPDAVSLLHASNLNEFGEHRCNLARLAIARRVVSRPDVDVSSLRRIWDDELLRSPPRVKAAVAMIRRPDVENDFLYSTLLAPPVNESDRANILVACIESRPDIEALEVLRLLDAVSVTDDGVEGVLLSLLAHREEHRDILLRILEHPRLTIAGRVKVATQAATFEEVGFEELAHSVSDVSDECDAALLRGFYDAVLQRKDLPRGFHDEFAQARRPYKSISAALSAAAGRLQPQELYAFVHRSALAAGGAAKRAAFAQAYGLARIRLAPLSNPYVRWLVENGHASAAKSEAEIGLGGMYTEAVAEANAYCAEVGKYASLLANPVVTSWSHLD